MPPPNIVKAGGISFTALLVTNHERPCDGPGHGRRVEAVVHQPLGDVHRLHARALLELAHVDDELVRVEVPLPLVQRLVVRAQPQRHVVGVEDGDLRGAFQSARAHHLQGRTFTTTDVTERESINGTINE